MSHIPRVTKRVPLTDEDAKWIGMERLTWLDHTGQERTWESTRRRTREKNECDAVVIFPVLRTSAAHQAQTILVKQFRPPTGKICVELPAGLIDAGETPEKAALRELKEETGYVGTVRSAAPVAFADPGMSNANLRLIVVDIDGSLPENINPQAQPEEGEHIEVETVPLASLTVTLARYVKEGLAVDSRLQALAFGLALSPQLIIPE